MGQQQLLLTILGVLIVGVAIAVSITAFRTYTQNSAKDAIAIDLVNLAADVAQYRLKPVHLGGGGMSFEGYSLTMGFLSNPNGTYTIIGTPDDTSITFRCASRAYPGNFISQTDSFNGHSSTLDLSKWKPK